jgi:hypothetical protein
MLNPLPKILAGAVCAQWRKCGKPGCRCARGQLHGPYWYRFWREAGRLRKAYVRSSELAETQTACEERRQQGRAARTAMMDWRKAARLLSELERLGKEL